MKRRALVAAAGAALALSVVPGAQAAPADHCLHPPYTETAPRCACIAVVTVLSDVTGDPWMCAL